MWLGVGWLDHMVTLFFNFLRKLQAVFCSGCTNLLSSPRVHKGWLFFTSLPAFVISYLSDKSLSDLSKPVMRDVTMVLTCILLMIGDADTFSCICWPSVCLLGKSVFSDCAMTLIFNWFLSSSNYVTRGWKSFRYWSKCLILLNKC